MIKKVLRCKSCQNTFEIPNFYHENHGLDTPPYERVAVCPNCSSSDFIMFDSIVEKIEVAEHLLCAISAFNRYSDSIKEIFGTCCENSDFSEGYSMLTEFIDEMFSFITVETEREILKMHTQNDIERVLLYLKG